MLQTAVEKAQNHLALARKALDGLRIARTFREYEVAWSQFLIQAARTYAKLEAGSKNSGVSKSWFGRMKHERHTDPLLRYIRYARNSDEHGLEDITRRAASGMVANFEPSDVVRLSLSARRDEDGSIEIKDLQLKTPGGGFTEVELIAPRIELMAVSNPRSHDSAAPPVNHLGRPIEDTSPLGVAELAISFLERMIAEATQLSERT